MISNYKKIKRVAWLSFKSDENYIKKLKNCFDYLITDNNLINSMAKKLNFHCFSLGISAPKKITLNKKNFLDRKNDIYFLGSLGSDFSYRFEILNFLFKNFKLKIRIRHLYEKYKILNFINSKLLKIFPKFTYSLYKKKFLPLTNNLKYINQNEIFGEQMYNDIKKYKFYINIHSDFGRDKSINMRVYEALSCGCLLITDSNKKMKNIFKDNEHVVYFKNKNELRKKLLYFSKNLNQSYEIAKKGNQLFINKYSSDNRFKDFLKILKKIIHE